MLNFNYIIITNMEGFVKSWDIKMLIFAFNRPKITQFKLCFFLIIATASLWRLKRNSYPKFIFFSKIPATQFSIKSTNSFLI